MIIKTVQTLVFEYPEDYQAEVEWNKKRDGDWVHQSTDTICSVYTLTNNYLIPTKAKHSFVDNAYFEADTPQNEQMKTADYCDICKQDMCKDCIADATNPYCVPSHYEINYEPKDEPKTQMKTQNSNLTFEKRTMLDCYNCKWYKSDDACVECRYEPKADTPQTESTGSPIGDYRDGVGAWQTDCGWGKPNE